MNYKVSHPTKIVNCEIDLPSSKSISNRLLIIKALCKEDFKILNLSKSDDTSVLKKSLCKVKNIIDVGPAGAPFRFLTSYLSILKDTQYILTGSKRIQERPISDLVDALRELGAKISYTKRNYHAPLKIRGEKIAGGKITIDGKISSQFISSLLLIAPTLEKGLEINIIGKIVSKSYIEMTRSLMLYFGVKTSWKNNTICILPQKYIAKNYTVESDWSAASFWYEIAALSKKCKIKLNNLRKKSIQGDSILPKIFSKLSVSTIFTDDGLILEKNKKIIPFKKINIINTPDIFQPLRCTLYALKLTPEIKGLSTLKNKETDRIHAMDTELKKLQFEKEITTYKDHRMAMSFAGMSIKYGKIIIKDIDIVVKSYPEFWIDLQKAGFIIDS